MSLNKLRATVTHQIHAQGLSKIEAVCEGVIFTVLILESSPTQRIGQDVYLVVKESEIAVSKTELPAISIANQIKCTIRELTMGEILCYSKLEFGAQTLSSIVTADSMKRLHLSCGDSAWAMIKANEVYLEHIDE